MDLDAYLTRIGYVGARRPTLETLRAIHRLHPAAIPFENLDPLLGRPPRLDLAAIEAKLVRGGRGGWCYEQNTLLQAALTALGFNVTGLVGRVVWGRQVDGGTARRSHMLLKVDLDEGPWLADVGFGGLQLTGPLALSPGVIQATPHEPFRILDLGDRYELQAQLDAAEADGGWRPIYSFTEAPQAAADYDVMNWFMATRPSSHLTFTLVAARATDEGRMGLADNRLTLRRKGQPPEVITLDSIGALSDALVGHFGLTPPAGLDRLAGRVGF